ncbi:hypothetical protein FCH28_26375 [Streptomyces piniterrae]|uniref:Uncharacterized protein n=1 Tax=Streptomyces piniterrae TaxID=2571125 RepID=A0A4U0MY48_9ACTN|nr:hypothetical protein [Streptomyces piniterrae]TJZ46057.1 hypothetical protein FCH28_26375 [Streptomyces piniterrae]
MPQFPSVSTLKQAWGRFLGLVGILLGLALSACFLWMGLTQTGVMGTPGTFTVEECHLVTHHSTSKRGTQSTTDYTCKGAFRSDDGKVVDPATQLSGLTKSHPKGFTFATQRSGNDVLMQDSRSGTVKFIVAFAFLLIDAFGYFLWVTHLDKNKTMRESWRSIKGTPARAIMIGAASIALVGMAASAVCALTLAG